MAIRVLFNVLLMLGLTFGWGQEGHKIVANIAHTRLSATASKKVSELLGGKTLMDVSVYADEYRSGSGAWSAPMHYYDLPKSAKTFTMDYCPKVCVVKAVQNYTKIVDSGGDTKSKCDWTGKTKEPCALEFLVHFVGDMHQPLHVGYEDDLGGNNVPVTFFDKKGNLHSLWDSLMLERWDSSYSNAVKKLEDMLKTDLKFRDEVDAAGRITDPVKWGSESHSLVRDTVYNFKTDGKTAIIDEAYYQKHLPIVHLRLTVAGVRLANSLNAAFATEWNLWNNGGLSVKPLSFLILLAIAFTLLFNK